MNRFLNLKLLQRGGYNKLITGSDQVWNFGNCKVDGTHFLNFAEDYQKIAYAVSFGTDMVDEAHRTQIAEWISHIPFLSVREPRGVEIVKELTGRDAQLVLDPSLLISKEQWKSIATMPKQLNYILVYIRERRSKLFNDTVRRLSQKTGLPVVELTPYRRGNKIGKCVFCPGPREWLGYFLNAEYVITNSFHGMAFSLNFNKQFYSLLLNNEPTNSRINGLLEQFSLQERIITDNTVLDNINNINYKETNALLQAKRESSMTFLTNALKCEAAYE